MIATKIDRQSRGGSSMQTVLGIDCAKAKFDAALLIGGKYKTKVFSNDARGFGELQTWLNQHGSGTVHACMEATGSYHEALALFLVEAGYAVSVMNPAQIKGFAQSVLTRTKTDRVDAKLIARFCLVSTPALWTPPAPEVRAPQALVSRLEALNQMRTQEGNRLATAQPLIRGSIENGIGLLEAEIAALKEQIRDHVDGHPGLREQARLLETIPGVGEATIAQLLAVVGDLARFKSARQLAAFLGLTPRQHQSGSSVRGKTRMAKMGHAQLRKALFFPAIVATRFNPLVRAFAQRLAQAGKPKMAIVGAAMRKLVHIIFGVLKSGRPFDPTMHAACV